MTKTKDWFLSKGIIGGIVAVIAGVGMFVGVEIDQAELTDVLTQAIGPLGSVLGGVVAVWGRKSAKEGIK